jgi:hypothetical protein
MECEEVKVTSELDDRIPGPVTFLQKLGLRFVISVALFGPAAAVFLTQYLSLRNKLKESETRPPTEYAMETAAAKVAPEPTATAPITVDVIANPPRSVSEQPATLQVTTKPSGATFAVYAGIIADKTPPTSAPLRSGTSPGTAEELHAGNYTIFFHKEGWPDSRTEVEVQAGAVLPIDYTFPHAEVTITSAPSGAEILRGTAPIGFTPLKVDLPPGPQELTARLKNYLDRKQTLTVDANATPTVEFQMRAPRRIARARPTPTPSFFDRVGGSLKHLFGGSSTPPPSRKRR